MLRWTGRSFEINSVLLLHRLISVLFSGRRHIVRRELDFEILDGQALEQIVEVIRVVEIVVD